MHILRALPGCGTIAAQSRQRSLGGGVHESACGLGGCPGTNGADGRCDRRVAARVLDDAQIASSRAIMGIDTQLIDDGTYFVVESDGDIAGCGGWSRRATLYGGNQTPGRASQLLDPAVDPA